MNIREIAWHVLTEVEKGKKSHLALADAWEQHPGMEGRDRRFLHRLVQMTWENQMLLDYRLDQVSRTPVRRMKPQIRTLLRMSACQIFYMDSVPASAVCNEAVKLVKKAHMQGLSGFVNGVLRTLAGKSDWPEEPAEIAAGIPGWILEGWRAEYGEERSGKMCESFHHNAPLSVFRNSLKVSEAEMLSSLQAEGVACEPAPFPADAWILSGVEDLAGLEAFRKGWIIVQDISSMLIGVAATPEPSARVLDVCAAPGGKSLQVARKLTAGNMTACDLTEAKIRKIEENLHRTGCRNVQTRVQDARVFVPEWESSMDLVLADLPCSGLGVLGRKPDIRFRITPEDIRSLQQLQREILDNVSRYVRPGGQLIYSTCTVTPEENRENREWILSELPFEPMSFRERMPGCLRGAMEEDGSAIQLLPGVHPCDGFYIAAFRRKQDH